MRRHYWVLTVGVFALLAATGGRAYADYCAASGGNCSYEHIAQVQVGSIDNVSSCSSGGYGDFTSISTGMVLGASYPITVVNGSGYAGDQCGVWVDWNQDQDFDDAGESVGMSGSPGPGPYTGMIVPPMFASAGATRMRVRIAYATTPLPCGTTSWGEVEDYTVVVSGEAIGACCTAGGCVPDMSSGDCAAAGGVFQGHGTTCDPNPCSGACCVDTTCIGNSNMADCAAQSGVWHFGEDCATFQCPQAYCEAGSSAQDEWISRVQLNTIDNPSTTVPGGYQNFTHLSTPLSFGVGYPLTVTNGHPYMYDRCGAWVDWNSDGDFDDAGEAITMAGSPGYGPYTATVSIPGGTSAGAKRLRIRISYNTDPQPCGIMMYGEVEDYTLIAEAPPQTGACCLDQSCTFGSADDCAALGGNYLGDGSDCDPNPCSGACCVSEECVGNTTQTDCTALGGTWHVSESCNTFLCPGPDYCTVESSPDPYINRVQFNTIDNSSSFLSGGYQDFTALSTDVEVNADYPITVTAYQPYSVNRCAAWVDWNRDGDFADAGEHYVLTAGAYPHTGTITVPIGTAPGTKRLRVRVAYGVDPEPCGYTDWGDAEDYTLVVLPPPPEGACCLDQSCTFGSPGDCANLGGTYLGDGSDCDPNPCSGACCVSEECVGNTTQTDCAALGGTWHVGEDCATFACPAPDYCEAFCGIPDPYISRVQLNTIDNPSTTSGGIGYQDFTAVSTDLEIGTEYPIVVTAGTGYSMDNCTAYVDWNRDGDFYDDGETFTLTPGVGPHQGTITPPPGTAAGRKRLRIVLTYGYLPQPCGEQPGGWGEVEDYSVDVVPQGAGIAGSADDPRATELLQNLPNPFRPGASPATIRFTLSSPGEAALEIFDAAGRRVRTLHRGSLRAGSYSLSWNGLDDAGNEVGSGVYFYRFTSGAYEQSRQITVIE